LGAEFPIKNIFAYGWQDGQAETFCAESGLIRNQYMVSAIVSTYNSDRFIRGCLEDLENQTIADKLEIIVINSGSEQNEEATVKEFQKKYSNIIYIKTEREGLYSAWNRAIKVASGQFLTNANTDDRHRKDAFEVMVNTLLANPDISLVYGDQIITDTQNPTFENHHAVKTLKWPEFNMQRLLNCCCVGSQPMWRKSLHGELGMFDETLTCAADWDFWLRAAQKHDFRHIPQVLGLYYHNEQGIEHGRKIHSLYERYAVGRRYGNSYIPTVQQYEARGNPLATILTAAHNCRDHIAGAIESVLVQTYRNFEMIIVDDGSTDDTADVARTFRNDSIKYFFKENGGVSSARNLGLKKSSGSFIVILDSDDMLMPDFLARHLQAFGQHPEADMVYCDDCFIDNDDIPRRILDRPEYPDQKSLISNLFSSGYPVVPFRTCIRKSVFDKIGFYDEQLFVYEDYEMLMRFANQGLKMHHLPEALYLRRTTMNRLSRSFNVLHAKHHFNVVRRFTETFTPEQLFPDVSWNTLSVEQKLLLAKCRTAIVYLGIGERYVGNCAPDGAEIAFETACEIMDNCCKLAPDNQQVRNLREKCLSVRAKKLSDGSMRICQPV
jgi:glycosyltransferase involved in cell wall biosynthesis